jgi:hypothetical protein
MDGSSETRKLVSFKKSWSILSIMSMLRLIVPPRPAFLAPATDSADPNIVMFPAQSLAPSSPSPSSEKSYGKLSWFLGGVIIGSFLDTFTIIVMIVLSLLWENRPLPEPFSSLTPQDFIVLMFKNLIRGIASLLSRDPKTR